MTNSCSAWLLRILYRFRAYNVSALDTPGPVLLLPNHVSWWDWLLIGVCLEDDWRFVTSSTTAELSWLHKRIMVNRRTFPVDMNSPFAVKRMAEYLQKGGRLVLFPEGRISCTGSLMKLFDGTGFLIFKTRPKVITAYIRGAERLPLLPDPRPEAMVPAPVGSLQRRAHAAQPRPRQRHRRARAAHRLAARPDGQATVRDRDGVRPGHLAGGDRRNRAATAPAGHPAGLRPCRNSPTGVCWRARTCWRPSGESCWSDTEQRVGVLLPNVNAMPVVTLSLWAAGKVPAILNYSTGASTLLACARLAGLKHIITSRASSSAPSSISAPSGRRH